MTLAAASHKPEARARNIEAASSDLAVAELIEQLTERFSQGESVDLDAFLERNPQHADRLRPLLPALRTLAEITSSSVGQATQARSVSEWSGARNRESVEQAFLPTILNEFHIIRQIGRGGMGIVYEAEQISLRRRVALKVLPLAGLLDERTLTRFRNEAQAAASLAHPHIVPIYAVGSERGVHYYAMQFIDGLPLDHVIASVGRASRLPDNSVDRQTNPKRERGTDTNPTREQEDGEAEARLRADTHPLCPLSTAHATNKPAYFRRVAELGIQAGEALHYAHERGIIHRDIKPANLLLSSDGKLWITDFGLARIEGETNLTLTGDLLGTLRYMSPEQASGNRLGTDHRTDIYSLGATLYELLTLQPAIVGHERGHLLRPIADEEPLPPSKIDSVIPVEIETIVLKSLAKDPADRYTTAADFADDFRRFLDHQPIRARRPTVWQRAKSLARRHTTAVLTGSAGVLLAAAVAVTAAVFLWRAKLDTDSALASSNASLSVARQHLYVSDIAAAHQACLNDDRDSARSLLQQHIPSNPTEQDQRGFEWHYLWRLCQDESRDVIGHNGNVYSADFSPDSQTLDTGGSDGVIRLWDVASGKVIRELRGHRTDVNSVVFHRSGQTLLSAGGDGTARLWDCATGQELHQLWAHEDEAVGAIFSPTGDLIATGGMDGKICLWDAVSHQLVRAFAAHYPRVYSIAFSADGRRLFTSAGREPVIAWSVDTCEQEFELKTGWHGDIRELAISRDGKTLVAAYNGLNAGALIRWDFRADDDFRATPLLTVDSGFAAAAFHAERHVLVSASDRVRIWDLADGSQNWRQHGVLKRHRGYLWCTRISPNGKWLVSSSRTGELKLSRTALDATELQVIDKPGGDVLAYHLSGEGKTLLLGDGSGTIVLDAVANQDMPMRREIVAPKGDSVYGLVLSPDQQWLALLRKSGPALLPLSGSETEGQRWRDSKAQIGRCTFSPDSRRIARSVGNEILYADVTTGMTIHRFSCHEPICCRFSLDGRWLAAGSVNGALWVWDLSNFQALTCQAADDTYVNELEFSRDGTLLATGMYNGIVKLWTVSSLRELHRLYSPAAESAGPMAVCALAFSCDAKTLAVGRSEPYVRLWQVATGRELLAFRPLSQRVVHSLRFTPDGQRLIAFGGADPPTKYQIAIWSLLPP